MPFADQDKLVFSYEVRGEKRFADPLALRRRFVQLTQGGLDEMLRAASYEPMPGEERDVGKELERERAKEALYQTAVAAFKVQAFDEVTGEGITESEVIGYFNSWVSWLSKKNQTPES